MSVGKRLLSDFFVDTLVTVVQAIFDNLSKLNLANQMSVFLNLVGALHVKD